MYKIISDSACDLSKKYIAEHDITIVPLSVSFDGETYYRDSIDISRDECYERMVSNPGVYPKTSLPSVDSYYNAFKEFTDKGIPVVCFTITVIDSKQNTVTQALIIDQMVRMRDAGISFEDSLKKLEPLMASARIFFTVGSLDYLKMGGRIGKLASIASKIDVKPVIIMKDGDISLGGIGRNRNKLKAKVLSTAKAYLDENGKDNFVVSVGYGYDKTEGVSFMNDVEETLGVKLNSETNVAIGIVSGVHTGPHPIGLGVIRKYETL